MSQLIAILGVSHKDIESGAYQRWVEHALWTRVDISRVVFALTKSAWELDIVNGCAFHRFALPDELENGYPRSASHLFLRSLEWAERNHPNSPVLWLECDAIPLKEGWLEAIGSEYLACGRPFMGHMEHVVRPAHMAGCGVYPPNWRQLAPSLATCHEAPDIPSWGIGKGQAFDTYAAHEIYHQAAESKSIKQIWNCPPFTKGMIPLLEGASLFHPSKDGRLISILNGSYDVPEASIDLVYPLKASGWWENEMRWSLRSIEQHAGHLVRNVWIVGDKPSWYNGNHIPFESIKGDGPNADQIRKLKVAVEHPDIANDFVWMNNDFYCQHEPDFGLRAHMSGKPTGMVNGAQKGLLINAMEILKWNGDRCDRNFELHSPMPMNKVFATVMLRDHIPFGHVAFRTLYGNLYYEDSVPMVDVKMRNWRQKPDPAWTWFSSDDILFESRGSDWAIYMEQKYPKVSRWEV